MGQIKLKRLLSENGSINEAQFDAEKALHWHEPYEVVPEMVAAAIKHVKGSDYYELMDLFNEYDIILDLDSDASRSEILNAIKHANWDAFQDDNEVIQLQDYIEEIKGQF